MKTVLITGCNGFIGRKLAAYLLKHNVFVLGVDIQKESPVVDSNYKYLSSNYTDFKEVERLLASYEIDVLYHLAWNGVSTDKKNIPEEQFVNISLTYSLLQLAKSLSIKKIVMPGSTSEFSRCSDLIKGNEMDSPSDLYAAVKVATRKIAYQFCQKNNMDLNWLLITSVYSAERTDKNLIYLVIKSIINKQKLETTKLEQKWDYLFIDDLIQAMYLVGEHGKRNQIYPIGSGVIKSLADYVGYIVSIMKGSDYIFVGAQPYKNDYIDNSMPNISELTKIGYKPNHFFENDIKTIIDLVIKNEASKNV